MFYKKKYYVLFVNFLSIFFSLLFMKNLRAEGQLSISSPSSGASYSSTANVSTSVSWSVQYTSSASYYLDRRVYHASSIEALPSEDTCYFTPVTFSSSTSGTQSGTLRDGSGSSSTTYSSANCFTYGADSTYVFVATIVVCSSSSYSTVSSCIEDPGAIISRAAKYFTHD